MCLQTNLRPNLQLQRLHHQQPIFLVIIVLQPSQHHCSVTIILLQLKKPPFLALHRKRPCLEETHLIREQYKKLTISLNSFLELLLKHPYFRYLLQVCSVRLNLLPHQPSVLGSLPVQDYLEHQDQFLGQLQRHRYSVNQREHPHCLEFHKITSQVCSTSPLYLISQSHRMRTTMMMVKPKQIRKHRSMPKVVMIKLCLSKGSRLRNRRTQKCLM